MEGISLYYKISSIKTVKLSKTTLFIDCCDYVLRILLFNVLITFVFIH